jgi:hypothetical protein
MRQRSRRTWTASRPCSMSARPTSATRRGARSSRTYSSPSPSSSCLRSSSSSWRRFNSARSVSRSSATNSSFVRLAFRHAQKSRCTELISFPPCRSSPLLHGRRRLAQKDHRFARDAQLRRPPQALVHHLRRHDRRIRQRPPDPAHRPGHPRRRSDGRARSSNVQGRRGRLEAAQLWQGLERSLRGRRP